MREVIIASMDLSATEADILIENAEVHSDFTISLQSHTAVINNFLSYDEKQTFIKNLWILANIDNELHELEFNMLKEVAALMGFNSSQLNQICELDN